MKITVVSYEELNLRKSDAEVIDDLRTFLKDLGEDKLEELGTRYRLLLENAINTGAAIEWVDTRDAIRRQLIPGMIKENIPDVLISYNLAGFEWTTLTDGLGYNLINCLQLHFIEKDELANEEMLDKLRGINLFIYDKRESRII